MDASGETVTEAPGSAAALVEELRGGSPDALTALFDRYGDRIHTHCFRQLGSWHEAEDATATVFLEVWRLDGLVVEEGRSAVSKPPRGGQGGDPTSVELVETPRSGGFETGAARLPQPARLLGG
jgi:hypothetical protein